MRKRNPNWKTNKNPNLIWGIGHGGEGRSPAGLSWRSQSEGCMERRGRDSIKIVLETYLWNQIS